MSEAMKLRWIWLLCFCGFVNAVCAQQLAFPGAEGGGRFATGGRGGSVYEVTNLNDTGAGSLRDAISQPNRTIVFRVSGVIHLNSKLNITQNNLTIAGQTAPGDGICITGYTVSVRANHIILRHLRFRLSDVNDVEDDALNSTSTDFHDIIIDHCSLSWSVDETGSFYGIKNFTLQWCILSESLYHSVHEKGNHGYGGIWGGNQATFHHNLLAHHTSRNPRFCGSRYTGKPDEEVVDFRNNVIYNWGNGNSAYGGEGGHYNMVNNYYKAGPATPGNTGTSGSSNKRNRILQYTSYYYGSDAAVYPDTLFGGEFYIDGNYVEGYADVTADNWTKGVQKDSYIHAQQLLEASRRNEPFATPAVATQTAQEAFESVLENAGATLPRRDMIDRRILEETRTGTATFEGAAYGAINSAGITHPAGIIDTQADVGGLPAYYSAPSPTDSDHDGMPDAYENENGLNPANASDRNNFGPDGYTNLETYLNNIEPVVVIVEPGITVDAVFNAFDQAWGSPSVEQTYTIAGGELTSYLIITPPAQFEVSANGGASWYRNTSPLYLAPIAGTVGPQTIAVRLNANSVGNYAGNIVHESVGRTSVSVPVSGVTSLVTGTEETARNNFTLTPNPANDQVEIRHPGMRRPDIVIYASTGSRCEEWIAETGDERTTIDIHLLQAGLYLLQMSENGRKVNLKFLKR